MSNLISIFKRVRSLQQTGNGKIAIAVASLRPQNVESELAHIIGLNPSIERHPAIEYLQSGDTVGLFNLAPGPVANVYSEHQLTTIYKLGDT